MRLKPEFIMTSKDTLEPRQDAGRATAEDGMVILDGPDGVAVTMTPEAAIKTAESLYAAAQEAQQGRGLVLPSDP